MHGEAKKMFFFVALCFRRSILLAVIIFFLFYRLSAYRSIYLSSISPLFPTHITESLSVVQWVSKAYTYLAAPIK